MEIEALAQDTALRGSHRGMPSLGGKVSTREQLVARLSARNVMGELSSALSVLTDYAEATHFMLLRADKLQDGGLDQIIASNWPFDAVRTVTTVLAGAYSRSTEVERCMSLFHPVFSILPDSVIAPVGASRQYCTLHFAVGRARLMLLVLFSDGVVLSQEKLREIGIMAGYLYSSIRKDESTVERDIDLTERELECLYWIAEGKTSDEIAVILGISRNTINNYITSVMRKTATKTRSEAIAYAVRNNLV